MPTFKLCFSPKNRSEQKIEVEDEEIEGMSEEEVREYVASEYLEDFVWQSVDAWVERVD